MKIVGVAACITGVAHTYMAQEAIEQECKKRGYDVKVETQGGMGIENELTEDEIAEADVVILAIAIGIEGVERFEEKEDAGLVISLNQTFMSGGLRHPESGVCLIKNSGNQED